MWAALRSVAELVKISAMVPAHSIPIWTRAAQVGISMRIFPGKEDDHRERQYDDHGHWAAYPLFRRDDLLADKPDTVRGEGMAIDDHRNSTEAVYLIMDVHGGPVLLCKRKRPAGGFCVRTVRICASAADPIQKQAFASLLEEVFEGAVEYSTACGIKDCLDEAVLEAEDCPERCSGMFGQRQVKQLIKEAAGT